MNPVTAILSRLVVLAQLSDPIEVPALAPGPVFERFVLVNPWPLAIVLVIAAAVAWVVLSRQGRTRHAGMAVGGLTLMAACIVAAASLVTTQREVLRDRTGLLVSAVARVDLDALDGLLADNVLMFASPDRLGSGTRTITPGGQPRDKAAILDTVRRYLGSAYPVKEHRVLETQVAVDGKQLARTQVHVRVTPEAAPLMHRSWWRLEWRREPDGAWLVTGIEPMQIDWLGP
jgi:hypothetical protein